MTDNILIDLSMDFAISIVNMCESIKGKSVLTKVVGSVDVNRCSKNKVAGNWFSEKDVDKSLC